MLSRVRLLQIVAGFAVLAIAGFGAAVSGLGCSDSSCQTVTTSPSYSCSPQNDDDAGCAAIPYPAAQPGFYALGCNATFPACSGFTMSTAAVQCTCTLYPVDGQEVPQWVCPN